MDEQRATAYHDTITDLRRELLEDVAVQRRIREKHRANRDDAYLAALLAANYAYTLAAVLHFAERELSQEAARRLAFVADEVLTNGECGSMDLNGDLMDRSEDVAL